MYIYICNIQSAIDGQMAGPNGLTLLQETHGYPMGTIGYKNSKLFLSKIGIRKL